MTRMRDWTPNWKNQIFRNYLPKPGTKMQDELNQGYSETPEPVATDGDTIAGAYSFPFESKFPEIAQQLKDGKSPTTTPRELLSWFNSYRRGINVVGWICPGSA